MADKYGRERLQQRFWLDVNDRDERILYEYLQEKKEKRQYSAVLRSALKLFVDLSHGGTDQLREQFPGLVDRIEAEAVAECADLESVHGLLQDLREQITMNPPAIKPHNEGDAKSLELDMDLSFDDDLFDDVEIGEADYSNSSASSNLLNSLNAF